MNISDNAFWKCHFSPLIKKNFLLNKTLAMQKRNKRKLYYIYLLWELTGFLIVYQVLKISLRCVTYTNISKIHKLYNEFISTVTLDTTNFNKYIHFATIWQKKKN